MDINTQYKNSVFSLLFSDPDVLRELYCALENITLPPDTPVIVNTLRNVFYMDFINDVSFVIGGKLVVLLEHQSTINPNMGLRFLMYISRIYEAMYENRMLYLTKRMCIPQPEFFVLYNGLAPYPDEQILKLSDLFMDARALGHAKNQTPLLELTVRVLNINEGRNADIASRCKALSGYSALVAKERFFTRQLTDRQEAIKAAVQYCMEHGILTKFIEEHGREVLGMRITEWNTEEAMAVWREEALEDGKAEALRQTACRLEAMGLSAEQIAEATGLAMDELKHAQEVLRMRITEWNTEEAKAVWREEALEEGLERGRAEGKAEGQEKLRQTARRLKAMGLSAEQIAEATGLAMDELN